VDGITWGQVKGFDQTYTWDNINLTPGTTYYYRVWYRNGDAIQTVNPSPAASVAMPPAPPAAPVSFQYTYDTSTSIKWRWAEPSGVVTGYVLTTTASEGRHRRPATGTTKPISAQHPVHAPPPHNECRRWGTSGSSTSSTLVVNPAIASFTDPRNVHVHRRDGRPASNSTLMSTGVEIQRYTDGNWSVLEPLAATRRPTSTSPRASPTATESDSGI
jgi:hypothetical protein